jgi:hypothetical protein
MSEKLIKPLEIKTDKRLLNSGRRSFDLYLLRRCRELPSAIKLKKHVFPIGIAGTQMPRMATVFTSL